MHDFVWRDFDLGIGEKCYDAAELHEHAPKSVVEELHVVDHGRAVRGPRCENKQRSHISRSPSCVSSRKWERLVRSSIVTVSGSERNVYTSRERVGRARARKKRWKQRQPARKQARKRRGRKGKTNKEGGGAVANGHRMWSNLRGMRTGRIAKEEEFETR